MEKRIKKTLILPVLFIGLVSMIAFYIGGHGFSFLKLKGNVSVAVTKNTVYKDWGELNTIPQKYSYSTIFYSANTTFETLSGTTVTPNYSTAILSNGKQTPSYTMTSSSDETHLLITNCAQDENGNLLDVVVDITNVNLWGSSSRMTFAISSLKFLQSEDQSNPTKNNQYIEKKISDGDPLVFAYSANWADANFKITYYKAGTYKTSNPQIATNLDNLNSFYYDIDVSRDNTSGQYNSYPYEANEFVQPVTSENTIYYKKNNLSGDIFTMSTKDQGIYVSNSTLNLNNNENIAGMYYQSSIEILTDGANGVYSFNYGGGSCGIDFVFITPKGYDIPSPIKNVEYNSLKTGQINTYTITQYVPNNYYSKIVNFASAGSRYTNFSNEYLHKFQIFDNLKNVYTIDTDNIRITDINELDVTSRFNITLSGKNFRAELKSEFLDDPTTYNNTFFVSIPVLYNEILENDETDIVTNNASSLVTTETDYTKYSSLMKYSNDVSTTYSSVKLTYDCKNGVINETNDSTTSSWHNAGSTVNLTNSCNLDGYIFKGFALTNSTNNIVSSVTLETENKVVYAVYEKGIVIKAKDQTKTYDGIALNADNNCEITSGELIDGHTLTCTTSGSQLHKGNSSKEITSIIIKDSLENDVTSSYNIQTVSGLLKVNARETVCTSNDGTKVYDSLPLKSSGGTCTNLVLGHEAKFNNTGSITNVSESAYNNNTISAVTINEGNLDVTNDYNITKVYGNLSVTPKAVIVTASTQEKVYDGTALKADNTCLGDGLVVNHTLTCTNNTGSQLEAGSSTKKLGTVTINNENNDVTSNYTITKKDGSLIVTRSNTASTGSCSNPTYNGNAQNLVSGGANVTYINSLQINYKIDGNYTVTASPTSNYAWSDGTYASRTLSCNITRKAVTYTADSASKDYDGTELTKNTATLTSGSLVSGHSATFNISGSQTNIGSSTNTLNSVTIKSGETDVTSNYNITKVNGTLTVNDKEYSIIYDLDGGSLSIDNPNSYTSLSDDIVLNNPVKEGYDFIGWTGTLLDDITTNVTIPKGSFGNREYVANYIIHKSILKIDPNGGNTVVTNANGVVENVDRETSFENEYGKIIRFKDPTKEQKEEQTKIKVTLVDEEEKEIKELTKNDITTYTFTKWEKSESFYGELDLNRYTYSKEKNVVSKITALYSENIETTVETLTLPELTKKGYEFLGWYKKDSDKKENSPFYTDEDVTLYAKFIPIKYKLTVDKQNGEGNLTYELVMDEEKDIVSPVKEEYEFIGWELNGEGSEIINGKFKMGYENATLIAKYRKLECINLKITSNKYDIDEKNLTISVREDENIETIKKNLNSEGEITISGNKVTTSCKNTSKTYTLKRYWIAKTGQEVINYTIIILCLIILITVSFIYKNRK